MADFHAQPALSNYVGTLVGESTSREFRLAVAHEAIREQDIIAVDASLRSPSDDRAAEAIRVWGKVLRIERLNPLFPVEAGHELAATRTNPFDTVLSLSREMVTAVCQVLGFESIGTSTVGRLDQLRYPPQPATSAYRPSSDDIGRIVLGDLQQNRRRALDLATLANRSEVNVHVDGHAVVTRHLAILAMTGAGKSWTARRLIEQLAQKNYPMVIFDPHGDYTGLVDVNNLKQRVRRYYARFPVFEEDSDTVAEIINSLGYPLTETMQTRFADVFNAAGAFIVDDAGERSRRIEWLVRVLRKSDLRVERDMWLIARLTEAGELVLRNDDAAIRQQNQQQLQDWGWAGFTTYSRTDTRTLEGIKKRTYKAAKALERMEQRNRKIASTTIPRPGGDDGGAPGPQTNRKIASTTIPLPSDRKELVHYGQISVVSLAGYTSDFQATIFSIIADDIFDARIQESLRACLVIQGACR